MKLRLLLFSLLGISPLTAQQNGVGQSLNLTTLPTGQHILHWHGKPGRSYFVQVSDENQPLTQWKWAPIIEAGNDEEISHEVGSTGDMGFYRLKYTDQIPGSGQTLDTTDFDSDGLSNIDEIDPPIPFVATDPLNPDVDADGLSDGFERTYGFNPNNSDEDGDGNPDGTNDSDSDGLSTFEEAALGTNPGSADSDNDTVADAEDADPTEPLVDWKRSQVSAYSLVEVPPPSFLPAQDLNDKGDVLFHAGIWAKGIWIPDQGSAIQTFTRIGSDGFPREYQVDFEAPVSMNNDRKITGYSTVTLEDGNGEEYTAYSQIPGQSPYHLWGALPANLKSTLQLMRPLGIDNAGRSFVFIENRTWNGPAGFQTTRQIAVSAGGDNSAIILSPPNNHVSSWNYGHFDVSGTGHVAANSTSSSGSGSSAYRMVMWDDALMPLSLPPEADGWYYPIHVAVLPGGKPALAGAKSGDGGGSVFLQSTPATMARVPSLSKKQIRIFGGDGTAITGDNKLWRNGKLAPLRDLCTQYKELIDEGWSLTPVEPNKHGLYLIQAYRTSEDKTFLMLPSSLLTRDPETGEKDVAMSAVISDPRPDVSVVLESAALDLNGHLSIRVGGNVRDNLSETLESNRISQLRFSVNGEIVRTTNLSYGPGQAPWTLADSLNEFDETLVIQNPKPGAYEIRVETDANAAGNTGWARVAVGLARETDPSPSAAVFDGISLAFSQNHSAGAIDTVTVFFGNRTPQAGDAIFTESALDSRTFLGTLVIGGQPKACTLSIGNAGAFQGNATDHLEAEISYDSGGSQKRIFTSLQETAAASLQFYPDGFQVNGEVNRIYETTALPGSQPGGFTPFIINTGIPESWLEAPDFKILANGEEHTVKKFTVDGKESMYVVNSATDTRPKVFIPCKNPLGLKHSVTGDNVPGGVIRWEIQLAGRTSLMQETLLLAGSPPQGGGVAALAIAAASAGSGWNQPGDTITWDDLVTAYKFIYPDEVSQKLLEVYLAEGHEVSLTDVYGDFDFAYFGRPGNKALIKIENDDEDVHPGIAAQYLWMGLNKALISYSFRKAVDAAVDDDMLDIAVIQAYKAQVGPAAAKYGTAAAELYLSGIGIINEPLDWVLVVNDVSDGHYASLAAALPFVSRGMVTAGKRLRIQNQSGQVLGHLDNLSLPALQDAALSGNLNTLGTVLDDYQLSTYIGKLVSTDGGWVKVPKREKGLKDAMRRRVVKPNDNFHAHHDFPWEHKRWFARHGINVNAPAFGRWVHEVDHKAWHKGTGGGEYNDYWLAFINAEDNANRYSISDILAKLEECRAQFPLTRTE